MKNIFLLILFSGTCIFPFWLRASNDPQPVGARSAGMAGVMVTLSDVWSISNNVAGITALNEPGLGIFAENRFNLKALSTVTLQGVYPLKNKGWVGLELSRFGDKLYNEQKFGLGYAHKIGPVSLGLKATILQLHLEELGSKRTVALSFGGQSEIIPSLIFGAHIHNLTQARLADFQDERFPTVMTAGLTYKPGEKTLLSLETEKDLERPANFKGGLEYKVIEQLALRTGFSSARQSATAGVGFTSRQLQIDYALGGHSVLGFSNYLSVTYTLD
jgi:hypothetical protein